MAELKKLGLLEILNLTKFLINFLHLVEFLRLLNLVKFLIFLALSQFFDYFTTTIFINLIVFIYSYYKN